MSGRSESPCAGSSAARCPPAPGERDDDRGGQLRPRPHAPRESVAASQRERLAGAMVAAVGQDGYERASVDAIVALAGVSTKALYRQFGSKLDCFLSTYDLLLDAGAVCLASVWREEGGQRPELALERALAGLLALPAAKPHAARLAFLEILNVGPLALPHMQRGEELVAAMLSRGLAQAAGGAGPPPAIARALVHGLWHVQRARMAAGGGARTDEAAALARWLISHCDHGVGRLSVGAAAATARIAERATSWPVHDERDPRRRALLACAEIVSEGGYATLSIPAVAARAQLDLSLLLEMFEDAEACYLATLEMLSARLLAEGLREAGRETTWARGVCTFVESVLATLAREPLYARVFFEELFAAGAVGANARTALLVRFAELLRRRAPEGVRYEQPIAQAVVGAVWGVLHRSAVENAQRDLPRLAGEASLLVLAPAVGAERALATIATRSWERGV